MSDTQTTSFALGQVWEDQDGLRWRIVAANTDWIYVKRHGYPNSDTIQTNPAWLHEWTRVS